MERLTMGVRTIANVLNTEIDSIAKVIKRYLKACKLLFVKLTNIKRSMACVPVQLNPIN